MEPEAARETDRVILRQIPFNLRIGNDAWGRDKPQPVLLSLEIPYDFQNAARDDNVSQTLDYGKLYKTLTEQLTGPYASAAEMVLLIRRILGPGASFQSTIVLPKANLRAEGGMHFQLKLESKVMEVIALSQSVSIKGIRCACIVGVNAHEREEKQIVVINLGLKRLDVAYEDPEMFEKHPDEPVETIMFHASYAEMVREVVKQVEGSTYQTVEALATAIARTITVTFNIPTVWVEVEKPNAIAPIEAAGVRIYREKSFFTEDNFWRIRQP